jgi:hypothetical protein
LISSVHRLSRRPYAVEGHEKSLETCPPVDLVPAERTLLEGLIPRRLTLRSDRRHGNRAASPSRSLFLIESQGTERSLKAPRRAAHDAGSEVVGSAVYVPRAESPTKGQPIVAPISVAHISRVVEIYMNGQARPRLVLCRNYFGVGPTRATTE